MVIVKRNYSWQKPLRSISVSAINLEDATQEFQLSFLCDYTAEERKNKLHQAIDEVHNMFGKSSLVPAIILGDNKMPPGTHDEMVMPSFMCI